MKHCSTTLLRFSTSTHRLRFTFLCMEVEAPIKHIWITNSHDIYIDSYKFQGMNMHQESTQLWQNAANNSSSRQPTLLRHMVEPTPLDSILPVDALIAKPATETHCSRVFIKAILCSILIESFNVCFHIIVWSS